MKNCLTRKNKLYHFLSIALAILLCLFTIQGFTVRAESAGYGQQPIELFPIDQIACESYLVYDLTTQTVLLEKNKEKRIFPASMTKIMTLLLTLEYLAPEEKAIVSQEALDATTYDSTIMKVYFQEELSVNDLVYGLMLPSGNDAANVLAEAVVDKLGVYSVENAKPKLDFFNEISSKKSQELGLKDTSFMNPSGLHHESHYTTAQDLVTMMVAGIKSSDFLRIISATSHVYKKTNLRPFDGWGAARTTNMLLSDPWILGNDSKVAQVVGGKTGTTSLAGANMINLTINQNGHSVISILCGVPYAEINRMTNYISRLVNEGSQKCWESDPVRRIQGDCIDNRITNQPADQYLEQILPVFFSLQELETFDWSTLSQNKITETTPSTGGSENEKESISTEETNLESEMIHSQGEIKTQDQRPPKGEVKNIFMYWWSWVIIAVLIVAVLILLFVVIGRHKRKKYFYDDNFDYFSKIKRM